MNTYAKRIITALLFTAGLVCLLIITSRITMPKSNEPDCGMEEVVANAIMAENPDTVDAVFLGDSETYCTFVPLQIWNDTGFTSYIIGTSEQTLDYSYTILERAFSRHSLKMVFLEANAIYRKESKEVPYAKLCELFPVFSYHDRWKSLNRNDFDLTATTEYSWTDYNKGYRYSDEIVPSTNADYVIPTDEKSRITPQNRYYVKKIKELCDSNGAELVLISVPSTTNFTYKRHNGTTELADELGCEFIDMNLLPDEMQLDWTKDTRDKGNHLNYAGATKVTAWMSEYLKNKGLMKSRKDDPDCAGWYRDVMYFEKYKLNGEKL